MQYSGGISHTHTHAHRIAKQLKLCMCRARDKSPFGRAHFGTATDCIHTTCINLYIHIKVILQPIVH